LGRWITAYNVDKAKPDDINIVAAIGQLHFDKLGTSNEKYYYRKRVRQESLPHANNQKLHQQDPGWRRMQMDPILDASFNVLPELTKPVRGQERPANLPADQEWDDGSVLPYLPQFGPYPDGVSTFGIAYSYYKRAEVLQNVGKQRHDQLSDMVVDSRPALSLKFWGEEEMEWGHRRELQAVVSGPTAQPFDPPMPENMDDTVTLAAAFPLNGHVKDPQALQLAIDAYARAAKLLSQSLNEYRRHILNFPTFVLQYQSYMEEIRAEVPLANADCEYMTAVICPPTERAQHLQNALAAYRECGHLSYINLLRFYIDGDILVTVLPPGFGKERTGDHKTLEDLSPEQARDAVTRADEIKRHSKNTYVNTDRYEFDRYVFRCATREKAILAITHPTTLPAPTTLPCDDSLKRISRRGSRKIRISLRRARGSKAQNLKFIPAAERILFGQQFDPNVVPGCARIANQLIHLAQRSPRSVQPRIKHQRVTTVDRHLDLSKTAVHLGVQQIDHLAGDIEFDAASRMIAAPGFAGRVVVPAIAVDRFQIDRIENGRVDEQIGKPRRWKRP